PLPAAFLPVSPINILRPYDTMIPFDWEGNGMFENKRIAVLGAGKLGEALITGMLDAEVVSRKQFIATAAHKERLEQLRTKLDIETTLSNAEAVRKAHLVLLCVKPQTVEEVLRQIADELTTNHILISVAASVTTRFIETGVKVGLPREAATQLAAQMVLGASSMVLETGEHPAKLKDIVTTPAGCTIDGILELEDGGLRVTLIKAVVRATQRAKELVN